MSTPLVVLIAILAGAIGNTLVKVGSAQVPPFSLEPSVILKLISNPALMGGVFLLVASFPLYAAALQRLPLSTAFPLITSLTFVIAALLSWFFLKESLTLTNILGILLLIASLWLIAKK